jgi:signal transduction histidine kinase
MNIRTRLSITFFMLVIVVMSGISFAVFFFAENDREMDFYIRLKARALNTAKVITDGTDLSPELHRRLEYSNAATLPDQYILMIDSLGREVYHSLGPRKITIDSSILKRLARTQEIHITTEHQEILALNYNTPKGRYILFATAQDPLGHESMRHLKNILIVFFLISVVLVSILSWFYSGRVLQPISRIIDEVGRISDNNLNLRLNEGARKDELEKLAKTFNDMLARLQNSFQAQKSFIANASHEIKTPITIMSGEIEVALLHDRNKEHYVETLQSVLNGLKRLNNLSTQLLLLTETSSRNPGRKFLPFRIDDVLWETKDWLEGAFKHYQVEVNFDADIDPNAFTIVGDKELIRAAISNLMDNGCKYSPENLILVHLNTLERGWLTLSFVNTGTLAAEERQKIFSPFYRGEASKMLNGFGIGLSLVNNVVKLHNGTLSVQVEEEEIEFRLKLPIGVRN